MLQAYLAIGALALYCLNPFEVREVLQEFTINGWRQLQGLNPFEVREVLQEAQFGMMWVILVSIPLKSGRCCKEGEEALAKRIESQSL